MLDTLEASNQNEKQRLVETTERKAADQRRMSRNNRNFGGNMFIVLERDRYSCVKCGMTNEEHKYIFKRCITVDHIDGQGTYCKHKNNNLSNLQTLCLRCHGRKDVGRRKLNQVGTHSICSRGHELTEDNVYIRPNSSWEECKICRKEDSLKRIQLNQFKRMPKLTLEQRKQERGWCSRHQRIHVNTAGWKSCRFPNDKSGGQINAKHIEAT
jgi:ribosomal protein S27AE